jgi:hypothetical protein
MDDFPQKETPRFWVALCIFGVAIILAVVMSVFLTVKAHAQQQCPPLESMIDELGKKYQEQIVWQGVAPTPRGPVEVMLFQSPKGTWTIIQVVGITACPLGAGTDATPIETGKGT